MPFTALEVWSNGSPAVGVAVYAQTMHQEEVGAGARCDRDAPSSASTAWFGPLQQRQGTLRTNRALQEKVPAALAAAAPILCVGTEEEREGGDTERELRHQVQELEEGRGPPV